MEGGNGHEKKEHVTIHSADSAPVFAVLVL